MFFGLFCDWFVFSVGFVLLLLVGCLRLGLWLFVKFAVVLIVLVCIYLVGMGLIC